MKKNCFISKSEKRWIYIFIKIKLCTYVSRKLQILLNLVAEIHDQILCNITKELYLIHQKYNDLKMILRFLSKIYIALISHTQF